MGQLGPPQQLLDDTDYIAGWLGSSALKCGYSIQSSGTKQRSSKSKDSLTTRNYILKTSGFVPIATLVARNRQTVPTPQYVKILFGRAIDARQSVIQFFTSYTGNDPNRQSDQKHQHFIDILKKTFDILWPFKPSQSRVGVSSRDQPKATETVEEQFANRFSLLTVEETTEADETSSDILSQTGPSVPQVTIERSQSESEEEFFFAIWALLHELHSIRELLSQICTGYKRDESGLDLVVVSQMTNTAIDLVRRLEQTFDDTKQRPARFPASKFPVWTLPALRYCVQSQHFGTCIMNEMAEFVKPSGKLLGFNMTSCDFCFYPVFVGLKSFLWQLGSSDMFPEILMNMFGTGPLPEDLQRTIELATIYRLSDMTYASEQKTHDEVSRGMHYAFTHKTIPIWVMFGFQILLDVQKLLGKSLSKPFDDLKDHALGFTQEHHPFECPFWDNATHEKSLAPGAKIYHMFPKDIMRACQVDEWDRRLRSDPVLWQPIVDNSVLNRFATEQFYFMKRQPILCGLMKYRILIEESIWRLGREKVHNDILAMAFVYVATRIIAPDTPT